MIDAISALLTLAGFDEFEGKAARSDIAVRSSAAIAFVFLLGSGQHYDDQKRSNWTSALATLLAMPLVIDDLRAGAAMPYADIAGYERPYPLLHWVTLAIGGRAPADSPPLAGVNDVWLDRVIAAHAGAPWIMRLLAARAQAA